MRISASIRTQILLLTILTLGPVIGLLIYFSITHFRQQQSNKLEHLQNVANLIATENTQINEGARQLLISLSSSPQLNTPQSCNAFLSELLTKYQRYANFGVVKPNGDLVCSAVQPNEPVNLADRYFFQQAMATNKFTVGEYLVGPITHSSILNFGYPLPNGQGVIYASLNLTWLGDIIETSNLTADSVLVVYDRRGTVLTGYPNPEKMVGIVNFSPENDPNIIFAKTSIGDLEEGPFVALGIPKSRIFIQPRSEFMQDLVLSALAGLISLVSGWIIGNSLINKLLRENRRVDELKHDFVSLVTHQIRTPITAIKWFTQILQSKSPGPLTDRQSEILADTTASIDRMTELVNTLLIISKLESEQIPLKLERFNLGNLIKETQHEIKKAFIQKHIKFTQPDTQIKVLADRNLIRLVIENLLANAYKYSQPKGQIKVIIKHRKNYVTVFVQDGGIGVPSKDWDHIWKKFARGSNAHKIDTEGAGLGLYLSKLIVSAHNGTIGLDYKSKPGSVFYFTLKA